MNDTQWNSSNSGMDAGASKLNRAEKAVIGSIDKLEHAMEHLTEKVEGSSQKLKHVVDLGSRQKEELLRIRDAAMPIYTQGVESGRKLISSVRSEPRPYLYGAALIVAGLILFNFRSRRAAVKQSFSYDESNPGSWAV